MKKIQFIPRTEEFATILDPPRPSSNFIPQWYKQLSPHITDSKIPLLPDGGVNLTLKRCIPFLDSITSGYMITLPADIYFVDEKEFGHRCVWSGNSDWVTTHTVDQIGDFHPGEGYDNQPWKWTNPWFIKTPPGYSILVTHPLNNFELPFFILSGIVDTDKYNKNMPTINFPFFIKNNFYGLIEKGTPIAQIIPFKRDEWKSEVLDYDPKSNFVENSLRLKIEKMYKKQFWSRKVYR